jgi:putative endopeptidase
MKAALRLPLLLALSLLLKPAWAAPANPLLPATPQATAVQAKAANYLNAIVDRSADPRQDFFQFAVGQWLKDNPIPASEKSWGIARVVQEETYQRLIVINDAASARAKTAPAGSNEQKIGDFWFAAMDTETVARQGLQPLAPTFARIEAVTTLHELLRVVAVLQRMGVGVMGNLSVFQDEKNSERYALHLYQGGLGLTNRDYYVDADERATSLRKAYVEHMGRMFELLGDAAPMAQANAATVMSLETELARASRKLEALRDPQANYKLYSMAELARLTPRMAWPEYLADGQFPALESVVVGQPEFYTQLDQLLQTRTLAEWKTYLRWHLAHAYAEQAGGAFDAEHFRFYGTTLNGTPEQRPRWKRMLDEEEIYLGDALGQLYVQAHFSPAAKARYEKLTDNVFAAFRARLLQLSWMSQATRKKALAKLNSVTKKVGYPARWKDYSNYAVTRDSFLQNCIQGRIWQTDYEIAKLGRPVDRSEWSMTPQTYNAYYNASNNEIVLPAAAFALPGIADADIDDALVYGYVGGTTIGHEITHGFDDEGRQFDAKGNLKTWWTANDDAEFKRRAEVVVKQYNAYIATGDLHVNGEASLGENIADIGGIVLGWDAFKHTAQYRSGQPLGGYTPAQRYYIGWALGWMNQLRPEALARQVKTDVHAPSFLRVIGPVTNQPEFYEAFGVKPGDKMYRAKEVRAKIW